MSSSWVTLLLGLGIFGIRGSVTSSVPYGPLIAHIHLNCQQRIVKIPCSAILKLLNHLGLRDKGSVVATAPSAIVTDVPTPAPCRGCTGVTFIEKDHFRLLHRHRL